MKKRHQSIVVVFLILRQEKKIFFKARKNTGFMPGYWALPAGHVEKGEFVLATALRELQEEVGVTSSKKHMKLVHVESQMGSDHERVNFYFEVTKWVGTPHNAEPSKAAIVGWMDPYTVRGKKFVPNESAVLRSIKKGEMYSEFDYTTYIEKQPKATKS